jgi:hypothetical protein
VSEWDVLIAVIALTAGIGGTVFATRRRRSPAEPAPSSAKILFPFVGSELSERALQATLRLAWAEHATVVPAYLTTVPLPLALDAPVGRQCDEAFDMFEAIEHKAAPVGIPVDGRIARGRNVRHAMRELIRDVPAATRIVVAAASSGRHDGFSVDDIAWLLRNAPGEVVVLRPDPRRPTATPKDLQGDPLLQAHSATHALRTRHLPTVSPSANH